MVDMKCEGCVNSVRNKLQTVNGMLFFWINDHWFVQTQNSLIMASYVFYFGEKFQE